MQRAGTRRGNGQKVMMILNLLRGVNESLKCLMRFAVFADILRVIRRTMTTKTTSTARKATARSIVVASVSPHSTHWAIASFFAGV